MINGRTDGRTDGRKRTDGVTGEHCCTRCTERRQAPRTVRTCASRRARALRRRRHTRATRAADRCGAGESIGFSRPATRRRRWSSKKTKHADATKRFREKPSPESLDGEARRAGRNTSPNDNIMYEIFTVTFVKTYV